MDEGGSGRVLIDGVATRLLDAADRGLQYGDGLFETIACVDGRPRWLERHLQRLRLGCERLGIPFGAFDALRTELAQLAAGGPRAILKVVVTRGTARARGYRPRGDEQATRIVSRHEWPAPVPARGAEREVAESAGTPALRLGFSAVRLGENPLLAGLKHLNRLEQVLAQRELAGTTYDEALMLSSTGQVISATSANVFLLGDGGLITPALVRCGVAGIARAVVLEAAARAGMPVAVREVAPQELARTPALFLTNARLGVRAVGWFNGRQLQPDPRVRRFEEWVDATMD